ncbi:NUDIX hydrolase [Exiguobacterium antarcticum]|uniref:NUDIX hydrolase n=1 Tax=Exiguobacterium antarcticum TaxID=132920 RepID=A0ABT6R3B5_9BACL|nr:NUDIX hydrolase [Exiguobacterium antarcticum]AFS69479.1 NUDIX hydrolase [Exiguobacterium antarcticum B7]MDI3235442.1 NUDIX hydrolase [Exiguobacterium antarcticum]
MNYVKTLRDLVGHTPLILVGAVVLVITDGQILLEQRNETQARFGLPGGLMEWAESTDETARRELLEETGLIAEKLTFLGVYSGKNYVTTLANGDVFQSVTLAYVTTETSGTLRISKESVTLTYFPLKDLPDHIVGSHRVMIEDYLNQM